VAELFRVSFSHRVPGVGRGGGDPADAEEPPRGAAPPHGVPHGRLRRAPDDGVRRDMDVGARLGRGPEGRVLGACPRGESRGSGGGGLAVRAAGQRGVRHPKLQRLFKYKYSN